MELTPATRAGLSHPDPLVRAINTWLESLASPNTRSAYRSDIQRFVAWAQDTLGGCDLSKITSADVKVFITHCRHKRESAKTVSRRVSTLSSLYTHLIAEPGTGITHNPVQHPLVRRPGNQAERPTPVINAAQLQAIAVAAAEYGPRWELTIALCSFYGLRASEVGWLRLRDLEQLPGGARLRVLGKGDQVDYLPLDQATCDVMADWLDERAQIMMERDMDPDDPNGPLVLQAHDTRHGVGEAVTRHAVAWMVSQVSLKALGVPITPHVLRKSTVHALYSQDLNTQQLMRWGRWRSLSTVRIYVEEANEGVAPTLLARSLVSQAADEQPDEVPTGRMRPLRHHRKGRPPYPGPPPPR